LLQREGANCVMELWGESKEGELKRKICGGRKGGSFHHETLAVHTRTRRLSNENRDKLSG